MKQSSNSLLWALIFATTIGVLLFIIGVLRNNSFEYWYLPYNLGLATIPLLIALWVKHLLQKKKWHNWQVLLPVFFWLLFLPNSFYIVTDFIHLPETQRVDIVQDSVMLMQFSVLGLIFGFSSLFILHKVYLQHIQRGAWLFVGAVLFLSSFAIYLGRELRWNSWDIIANPLHLVADIFAIIFYPWAHSEAWFMLVSFFGMLTTLYGVMWYGRRFLQKR